ncbi:MAG: heavy-metal-associated domain-containing protein [Desulfobacter sp.]|nr:heavy-metal-associated domain-containing protein [Desulfobacter sp.]WDP85216.1 MAG: heavy-metal-associated domain-containing protein [Desulfobacter sp.]
MENKLSVKGMSCAHCTGRVKTYLESLDHVSRVHVDLETQTARFESETPVDMDLVIKEITAFGFTAKVL